MSGRLREDRFASAKAAELPTAYAKRLAWALKSHRHLLAAAVRLDTSPAARKLEKLPEEQIPERVGRIILERADPTLAKTMTGWLVKQYAQGGLRLEDTGTANETLDMFQRYAPRLPEGQRDLGQYQSLAEAWDAVFHLAEVEKDKLSHKAQKALDRNKAYAESRILRQDSDGFTIAVPLTEFAAKWWGKGTRWCTAAEKDNQFWHYHEQAPLIVIDIPELKKQGKFQLWVPESNVREVQFMDAAHRPVTETVIEQNWNRLGAFLLHAMQTNGRALRYVPEVLRTEELCRIAVSQNGYALEHVPQDLRTEQFCRFAMTRCGLALKYVPQDLRSEDMCRIAVAENGWALAAVPKALRTEEMCMKAMARNAEAVWCVPEALLTEKMCKNAVARFGFTLGNIPQKLRTSDICRIAVAECGWALEFVPDALRTGELCKIAVTQDGRALEHVPLDFHSEEMYRIAVTKTGIALQYVPLAHRSEDLCRLAFSQNGLALEYVPKSLHLDLQPVIKIPQPTWDLSLLDKLAAVLSAAPPSNMSKPPHV
jgi:hypothetical protein